jgi:hypothetical protein
VHTEFIGSSHYRLLFLSLFLRVDVVGDHHDLIGGAAF